MNRFFDSDIVRKSIEEMSEIQDKIFEQILTLSIYDDDKKREHLELMREFLEKQKNFIFRLSLSDDPEAIELKNRIIESAKIFGLTQNGSVDEFFKSLETSLNSLEKTLDN